MVFTEESKERSEGTLLQYIVPTLRAIASDVSKRPNSLLTYVEHGGRKKFDELRHSTCFDNHLGVVACARGNVC